MPKAPATNIAGARFSDYEPLLRLGRTEEALRVLLDCRQVFQDAHDPRGLGKVLGALADVEDTRGHGDTAIRLQRDALRYLYLAGQALDIAASYHNLGNYLALRARQPAQAHACHLTAALIQVLTGGTGSEDPLDAATADLRELGTAATLPSDVADLSRQVGDIPGTDLPSFLATLSPDPEAAEQALRDLIAQAQALSTQD